MTTRRRTSTAAYHAIKDGGLLSKRRWEVYEFLFENGPCTAKEVTMSLRSSGQNDGVYTTRLSELRRMGAVEEIGETACDVTGHKVIQWDVTGRLPDKAGLKSNGSKIKRLEEENARLKAVARRLYDKWQAAKQQ